MKRRLFTFLFLLSASSAASAFESVPRRIASMNLTADEILVEIVPVERLVAATAAADDAGTSNIVGRVPPGVARSEERRVGKECRDGGAAEKYEKKEGEKWRR